MAEEHQPVGLCGPEVERDGSRLLRRPLAQCHVRLWGVKGHGVQRGHTLTLKGHHPTDLEQMGERNQFFCKKKKKVYICPVDIKTEMIPLMSGTEIKPAASSC